MAGAVRQVEVYLEVGKKRTIAGALDWPGWCRVGRDGESALQALLAYGPRYARALRTARLGFRPPTEAAALVVKERLVGDATTDYGVPGIAPSRDRAPVDDAEVRRLQAVLRACWRELDAMARAAEGKELRKGPRGGGRELQGILDHVLGAERAYLGRIGIQWKENDPEDPGAEPKRTRQAVLTGLVAAAHGELPTRGPRGGVIWTPGYFVRREAWHVLDHAWEIEDRAV